ncbi:MAG: DUF3379 family protein [Gammaproteobacteria bacterium]
MNNLGCIEFRQIVGAEPATKDKAVLRHRLECRTCGEHARYLQDVDRKILAALRVGIPEDLAARVMLKHSLNRRQPRWLALAATVLIAIGAGGVSWNSLYGDPLDTAIIAHIHHEPELLLNTDQRVSSARLQKVLYRGGAKMNGNLGEVSYAGLCQFRGQLVAHLVLQGERGPITLILLPNEKVDAPTPIDENGFQGVILPLESGSVAVVGMDGEPLEVVEYRVKDAITWGI